MGLLQLLIKEPKFFLLLVIPLMYSVIIHETAHGFVAYLFGDDTAKRKGRLSLNPLVHLDPLGTIMLFIAGFGWAKPVPVDFRRLKNPRVGLICVSLAGCLANVIAATLALFALKAIGKEGNHALIATLMIIARINLILASFNLIPIPPLDGAKIVLGLLPTEAARAFAKLEAYGFPILLLLLFTGLISPVINSIQNVILGMIGVFF